MVLSYFGGKLQIYHCVCRFYSMLKCFGWLRISSVFVLAFSWSRPSTLYVHSINHCDTFASTGFLQWTFSLFLSSGFTNVSTSLCHCVRSSVCCVLALVPCSCLLACFPWGLWGIAQLRENMAQRSTARVCAAYILLSLIRLLSLAYCHHQCQTWVCHSACNYISATPLATSEWKL